jgi:hypothetical protein
MLVLGYYLTIYVERLRETKTNFSYDSPFPHRVSRPEAPEYKGWYLPGRVAETTPL